MSFGERYLMDFVPDPACLAGEPWGVHRLVADLPGGPYRFDGLTSEQTSALSRRWAGFVLPDDAPFVVQIRMLRTSPDRFRRFDLKNIELTLEARYSANVVDIASYDLLACLDWSSGVLLGTLWTSAEPPDTFAGIVETLCRGAVAYRLREIGGVLIHGAAVVHEGLAYVFFGPSGSGKSTISASCAAAGDAVVSDDLNALALLEGRFVVLPLPFCGDLKSPSVAHPVPVAALCRLKQATDERAEPLGRAKAVGSLTACAPFVNCDPYRTADLLAFLDRAVGQIPSMLLSFKRDALPWQALKAAGLPA